MKLRPETIIVQYVSKHIHFDNRLKKHCVQFADVSDKPSKLMQLQTWTLPFEAMPEAQKTRDDYLKQIENSKTKTFVIILMPSQKKPAEATENLNHKGREESIKYNS